MGEEFEEEKLFEPTKKRGKFWFAALRRRKNRETGIIAKVKKRANSEVRAIAKAGASQYCPIIIMQIARLDRANVQTEAELPIITRSAADLNLGFLDDLKTR